MSLNFELMPTNQQMMENLIEKENNDSWRYIKTK